MRTAADASKSVLPDNFFLSIVPVAMCLEFLFFFMKIHHQNIQPLSAETRCSFIYLIGLEAFKNCALHETG